MKCILICYRREGIILERVLKYYRRARIIISFIQKHYRREWIILKVFYCIIILRG